MKRPYGIIGYYGLSYAYDKILACSIEKINGCKKFPK